MTTRQAIKILKRFNRWRRGEEMPDPKQIGLAIDKAIEVMEQGKKKTRTPNP